MPFIEKMHPRTVKFQKDNSPAHSAKHKSEYYMDDGVATTEFPVRSPDLKPIQNIWVVLLAAVYQNGRCFDTEDVLRESIQHEWENIDNNLLSTLAYSMPNRCVESITKRGSVTHY